MLTQAAAGQVRIEHRVAEEERNDGPEGEERPERDRNLAGRGAVAVDPRRRTITASTIDANSSRRSDIDAASHQSRNSE